MFQPLAAQVDAILRDAFAALNLPSEHARAAISGRPELADLQCNDAMPAAKAVGGDPRAIASDIKDIISARPEFTEVSVAGPIFLNMRLSPTLLARTATEMGVPKASASPTKAAAELLSLTSAVPTWPSRSMSDICARS